jgi:Family of unknown function (DUF6084)
MPELGFAVDGAAAVPYCATPTLALKLRVTSQGGERVHTVALDCQVRIEAQRRRYGPAEKERLVELFGEPSRWGQTLRSLLWTHASVSVPPFEGGTVVDLQLPCTADFNMLAGKYFAALEDGKVPISLLFSGSVFYAREDGALQVARVPWSAEAAYDLPVTTWNDLLDLYFPNLGWLSVRRDVFDRLYAYRTRRGLPTWEQALDELLEAAAEQAPR